MDTIYNTYFFTEFYKENGGGDYLDESIWKPFFGRLADQIIEIWNPQKVLDAGCARGYLVEALRDRGVEAYGIDISSFAIKEVRDDIKPYCNVQSVAEELPTTFPKQFDLITCIEVLEHLYSEDAEKAVKNLCKYTEMIVFSSTPDDVEDQTHVNVQLAEYWARLYASNSFYRNIFQKMDWLSPWASLYVKRQDICNVINEYERRIRIFELQSNKDGEKLKIDLQEKEKELEQTYKMIGKLEQEKDHMSLRLEEMKKQNDENEIFKHELQKQTREYETVLDQIKSAIFLEKDVKNEIVKLREELYTQKEDEKDKYWKTHIGQLQAELEYYKQMAFFESYQKKRANDAYNMINSATMWKATKPLRKIHDFVTKGSNKSEEFKFELEEFKVDKTVFIAQNSCTAIAEREHLWPELNWNEIGQSILEEQQRELSRREMELQVAEFEHTPLISVIVPLYNPPMEWLPRVIETLQAQIYPYWELCVADDGSPKPEGRDYMKAMAKMEPRIKFIAIEKNGGISAASNVALELAKGEFIALVDQDDEITTDAFFWMIKRLNEKPQSDFIYSDECKLDSKAAVKYFDFYFKPGWSPRLLMNHMYTGHLSMYRTSLVKKVGGFRSKFDFSQDYDLALRISDNTSNIEHVERVLYFWRAIETSAATGAKDFARVGNMHALKDWYNRHGLDVVMQMMPRGNYGRIIKENWPLVSVIIPTDNEENLCNSIRGLLEATSYSNLEIIPVTNSKLANETEKEFAYLEDVLHICRYDKPYNFSDKCNTGAQIAHGEVFLFYNDDVVPTQKDWLERLVELLDIPDIGSVSPMLTKPDNMLQYAGMITGTPGLVGTAFNGYPADDYIYGVYNHMLLRDVTVLSGACFAIKKELFCKVGGFDAENTPNGHSDVDLSFKIIDNGFYNVYTPYSRLVHIGNHSWHETLVKDKADIYCLKQWGKFLVRDKMFTESQKQMFYVDFPYKYEIYSPDNVSNSDSKKRDILFVTHELSRTGAPIALMDAVKCSLIQGDFPVVLSYKDGDLREEYLNLGVTVIIDESAKNEHWMFERFARNFDIVFINSIAAYSAVNLLKDSLPDVYWWLHDGWYALKYCDGKLPKELGRNVNPLFVSEYVKKVIEESGYNYKGEILRLGGDLPENKVREYNKEKLRFLFIGSFEERKGPDILTGAIKLLPSEIAAQCEFVLIGSPMFIDVYKRMQEFAEEHGNVIISENIPREDVLKLYRSSFATIIPSRDEPLSIVAIESMAASCPVICSDHCGIAHFMVSKENGIIFDSENVRQLADIIAYAVRHLDEMDKMGREGQKIYLKYFTLEAFRENYCAVVK